MPRCEENSPLFRFCQRALAATSIRTANGATERSMTSDVPGISMQEVTDQLEQGRCRSYRFMGNHALQIEQRRREFAAAE